MANATELQYVFVKISNETQLSADLFVDVLDAIMMKISEALDEEFK